MKLGKRIMVEATFLGGSIMFPKFFIAVPIAVLAIGGSTACATKKFVRTTTGEINDKVDSLGRSVEQTQERVRQNEGRISEVDQKAQAASQSAQQANSAAAQASSAAAQANNTAVQAGNAAAQAANAANAAGSKADALDRASRRLVYEVVLSEDQSNFKFGQTTLPDEAKKKLDEVVTQLKADPKGAFFEIEGHTDNVGPNSVNDKLGMERAEAVKRYLYEQHQIPLHKMNVISYGEEKPIEPNETREGRARNRRVVIKILA
jgi:outer membrane protein OmpA-like peptidoglycan-associated protein